MNNQYDNKNISIYCNANKHGFRYNITHEKINELYRRYKVWKNIPAWCPLSDDERHEFEKFLDGIFTKK